MVAWTSEERFRSLVHVRGKHHRDQSDFKGLGLGEQRRDWAGQPWDGTAVRPCGPSRPDSLTSGASARGVSISPHGGSSGRVDHQNQTVCFWRARPGVYILPAGGVSGRRWRGVAAWPREITRLSRLAVTLSREERADGEPGGAAGRAMEPGAPGRLFSGPRRCIVHGSPECAAGYPKTRRLAAPPFNARTCIRWATSAIPAGDPTACVNVSS